MTIRSKQTLLVAGLFTFLIGAVTFPLFFRLTTCMPGFFSTDESFAMLWNAWLVKSSFVHHLSIGRSDYINFPYGIDILSNRPSNYLWVWINGALALCTSPVLTYNIQVMANLFLCALCMFLLVRYISGSALAGFFSGTIFAFCPYIAMRSWQHLGETYQWIMPLVLYALFALKDQFTKSSAALLATGLIFSTFASNPLYITVALGLFFTQVLFFSKKSGYLKKGEISAYLRRVLLPVAVVGILLLPQIYTITHGMFSRKFAAPSVFNPYRRSFDDLFPQSARPLSYFLPASVHPVFGKFTEQFVGTWLYGTSFTEHTLYLGWVPMILAFFAWRRGRTQKKEVRAGKSAYTQDYFYVRYFAALAAAAWLFSQPPWWDWGFVKVPMPSFFMYKVLPMFRAYCRFGIELEFAIAVLAGYMLKYMLEKQASMVKKLFCTGVLAVAVLFEFWTYPPFKVIDVSHFPAVYEWLRQEPAHTVVAEYPLDIKSPSEMYRLFQTRHEKRMINYFVPGSAAYDNAVQIQDISQEATVARLKNMGVMLCLVHHDRYLATDIVEDRQELEAIPKNRMLKLLRSFPAQACPEDAIACVAKSGQVDVYQIQ